jgi:hypothetical protein
MKANELIKIIKDRYISAHCNPDFTGDKFEFIFAPIELPSPEITDDKLFEAWMAGENNGRFKYGKFKLCMFGELDKEGSRVDFNKWHKSQSKAMPQVSDEDIESNFDEWLVFHIGVQDSDIFGKGTLVRQVAIDYAKALRDGKIKLKNTDK